MQSRHRATVHSVCIGQRQLRVWRHNEQLLAHTAMFGAIEQLVENGFVRYGHRSFKRKDLQRPDWICGVSAAAFQLAQLVQKVNTDEGGELFFVLTSRPRIWSQWFGSNSFFFVRVLTTLGSILTHAVDRWPEGSSISTAY